MEWYRAHHGLPNDPKLALIASKCRVRRGEVLEVWLCLLDFASQNEPRGNVNGYDVDQIGWTLEMEADRVGAIVQAMEERGMIDTAGNLSAWSRRQPKREREDDSRERVTRHRENRNAQKRHVTPRNAQIDREIERTDKKESAVSEIASGLEPANGKPAMMMPLPASSDFPKTFAECRQHDPATTPLFVARLAQVTLQAALSDPVGSKHYQRINDRVMAEAVKESYTTGPPGHRLGLLLSRVPAIVISWCQEDS